VANQKRLLVKQKRWVVNQGHSEYCLNASSRIQQARGVAIQIGWGSHHIRELLKVCFIIHNRVFAIQNPTMLQATKANYFNRAAPSRIHPTTEAEDQTTAPCFDSSSVIGGLLG